MEASGGPGGYALTVIPPAGITVSGFDGSCVTR